MTGKIDPLKLTPLDFPARPDPKRDWTDDAAHIAQAFGVRKLSKPDKHRLACGWKYSHAAAEHFEVISRKFLVHTKGRWAGEPIEWADWQREQWIRPIFGWHDQAGRRSINRVYIECGKKSGKSTFAAAVAVYMAQFVGESGAEVYCLASNEDQAKIVHLQAEHYIIENQQLEQRARIKRGQSIFFPQTKSIIEVRTSKGKSGYNPFCIILDELHEWQGQDAFDRWTYGSAARDGWLHLAITNAGDETESVCFREHERTQKLNAGEFDEPNYYGRIYGSSREEAEAEIESVGGGATRLPVASKCNPGLGSILRESDLVGEIRQALHVPANLPNLLRFWYCVWRTNSNREWLVRFWDENATQYKLSDLTAPMWLGLDMSSTSDMTALVAVTAEPKRYRMWPWYWVPRVRADELRKWTAIELWEASDEIAICPGHVIDKSMIAQQIVEICQGHDVRGLVYDPRESQQIINEVQMRCGIEVIPFVQSHENYHEPTDEFEAAVKTGRVHHTGHRILSWQIKHADCVTTTHDRKKPLKPDPVGAPHKTVDGVQAGVMAFSQAMHYDQETESVEIYELL